MGWQQKGYFLREQQVSAVRKASVSLFHGWIFFSQLIYHPDIKHFIRQKYQ